MEKFLPFDLEALKEDVFARGQILSKGGYRGDSVTLLWVLSGQCKAFVNGREEIMNADDMFYCNAPRLSREALRRSGQKMKES